LRRFKKVFFIIAAFLLLYGFDNNDDYITKIDHPMNYQEPEYEVGHLGYPSSDTNLNSIYGLQNNEDEKIYDKYNMKKLLTKVKYNYMVSER